MSEGITHTIPSGDEPVPAYLLCDKLKHTIREYLAASDTRYGEQYAALPEHYRSELVSAIADIMLNDARHALLRDTPRSQLDMVLREVVVPSLRSWVAHPNATSLQRLQHYRVTQALSDVADRAGFTVPDAIVQSFHSLHEVGCAVADRPYTLYYNPAVTFKLCSKELRVAMAHELGRIVWQSHTLSHARPYRRNGEFFCDAYAVALTGDLPSLTQALHKIVEYCDQEPPVLVVYHDAVRSSMAEEFEQNLRRLYAQPDIHIRLIAMRSFMTLPTDIKRSILRKHDNPIARALQAHPDTLPDWVGNMRWRVSISVDGE